MSVHIHTRDTKSWDESIDKTGTVKNNIVKHLRRSGDYTRWVSNKIEKIPLLGPPLDFIGGAVAKTQDYLTYPVKKVAEKNADRFNKYDCNKVIADRDSRKDWSKEEKEHCKAAYEQAVFSYAYNQGDDVDKRSMVDNYINKCKNDKNHKNYKLFCKEFKELEQESYKSFINNYYTGVNNLNDDLRFGQITKAQHKKKRDELYRYFSAIRDSYPVLNIDKRKDKVKENNTFFFNP